MYTSKKCKFKVKIIRFVRGFQFLLSLVQSCIIYCRQIYEFKSNSFCGFTANFWQFTSATVEICLGTTVKDFRNYLQILNLKSILRCKVSSCLPTGEKFVYLSFSDNNQIVFPLWWKENVLKREKVFQPIRFEYTLSLPTENIRNLTVFWYFQGVEKGCIGNEWVNVTNICQRL